MILGGWGGHILLIPALVSLCNNVARCNTDGNGNAGKPQETFPYQPPVKTEIY